MSGTHTTPAFYDLPQYWIVTIVASASLALLALNVYFLRDNRAVQKEITARQQFVQQSVQLEGLYREIVRALAELAARNNDADVRAMLAKHGITYTVNPSAPGAGAPAPAAPPRK
jgi:hypothetical protein